MTDVTAPDGRFIVFEGIDGAGTTTQAGLLKAWLEARGQKVLDTCQPSNGPFGAMVRNALKRRIVVPTAGDGPDADVDPRVVALLFAADRLDHLDAVIRPALARGWWVISDRYVDSSLAYQSIYADLSWIRAINTHAPRPDRVFYIDVSPAVAISRILARRATQDHFETQQRLEQVHAGYQAIYADAPAELVHLDGTLGAEELAAKIAACLEGSMS